MIKFESLLPEILTYFDNAELASKDLRRRTLSLCGRQVHRAYSSEILETILFKAFEHLETIRNIVSPAFRIFVCDRNALSRDLPGWAQLTGFSTKDIKILMYNVGLNSNLTCGTSIGGKSGGRRVSLLQEALGADHMLICGINI